MADERIASNLAQADSGSFTLPANSSLRVYTEPAITNNEFVWLLFNDGTSWRLATEGEEDGIVCRRGKQLGVITNPSSTDWTVRLRKSITGLATAVDTE